MPNMIFSFIRFLSTALVLSTALFYVHWSVVLTFVVFAIELELLVHVCLYMIECYEKQE